MLRPIIATALAATLALPVLAQTSAPAPAGSSQAGPPTIYVPKPAPDPAPQTAGAPVRRSSEAPANGVLFLYGDKERCPTDANGNEVVVCVRKPAGERFRIPSEIRPDSIKPEYQSFAQRVDNILSDGGIGIGDCSPVGAGGQTGCAEQAFARARAERKARKAAEAANQPQ